MQNVGLFILKTLYCGDLLFFGGKFGNSYAEEIIFKVESTNPEMR